MPEQFVGRVEITTVGSGIGQLIVRDKRDAEVFGFVATQATMWVGNEGNEGDIRVFNKLGNIAIHLDGETGDIKLNGADCAEYFELAAEDAEAGRVTADDAEPGTVMGVDADGHLRCSRDAYDKRVVGVVSGAGGRHPGIILGNRLERYRSALLAVTGTTHCKADADYAAIDAGDLLTTSATPGHAMKATDREKAFGAVLGKALAPLPHGKGLVPVLVALQ